MWFKGNFRGFLSSTQLFGVRLLSFKGSTQGFSEGKCLESRFDSPWIIAFLGSAKGENKGLVDLFQRWKVDPPLREKNKGEISSISVLLKSVNWSRFFFSTDNEIFTFSFVSTPFFLNVSRFFFSPSAIEFFCRHFFSGAWFFFGTFFWCFFPRLEWGRRDISFYWDVPFRPRGKVRTKWIPPRSEISIFLVFFRPPACFLFFVAILFRRSFCRLRENMREVLRAAKLWSTHFASYFSFFFFSLGKKYELIGIILSFSLKYFIFTFLEGLFFLPEIFSLIFFFRSGVAVAVS